jgi:hypothetical protein
MLSGTTGKPTATKNMNNTSIQTTLLHASWNALQGVATKAEPAATADDIVSLSSGRRFTVVALHEGPGDETLYEAIAHDTGMTAMLRGGEVYISRKPNHWSA